jgi:hypothetical protein
LFVVHISFLVLNTYFFQFCIIFFYSLHTYFILVLHTYFILVFCIYFIFVVSYIFLHDAICKIDVWIITPFVKHHFQTVRHLKLQCPICKYQHCHFWR